MTCAATSWILLVAPLVGGDDLLRRGDPAERIGPLLLGGALEEDRRVCRVRARLVDALALGEETGVGRGGIKGQQDGAVLRQGPNLIGDLAEDDIGHREDDHIGRLRCIFQKR